MGEAVSHADRLQQEIRDLTKPLRAHYREIDRDIASIEQEIEARREKIAELRKTKEKVRQIIRMSDPDFEPRPYKKNGQGKEGTNGYPLDSPRVTQVGEWLQANAEELNAMNGGTGFFGRELHQSYPSAPLPASSSSVSMILHRLHDRGTIRLTKKGGMGGRKYYKVVV